MTVKRELDQLMKGRGLHEITAMELAECIVNGLKARALLERNANIRDGGPILDLGILLDRWQRAHLEHWDKRGSSHGADKPG